MADAIGRPSVVPLPPTKQGLIDQRRVKLEINLNDHIDAIHLALWGDPEYMKYLDGVYDEDTVEGSQSADDMMIAIMFRKYAEENGDAYVAGKKLHTIVKSLKVVWRRYGVDRNSRRGTVGGEAVATE